MSSQKKVLIHCEGPTEEQFVKDVLGPHLRGNDVYPIAKIVTTKRTLAGADHKGGLCMGGFPRVEGELKRLLCDTSAIAVTTLYDFYGLPDDFPRDEQTFAQAVTGLDKAKHLEERLEQCIGSRRFRAYLQLHEFEAMLFTDGQPYNNYFAKEIGEQVDKIRQTCGGPESVNNQRSTSPSHRLTDLFDQYGERYDKVTYGSILADDMTLHAIRQACPHFNEWLTWLENL
jgi:hypothetical protein